MVEEKKEVEQSAIPVTIIVHGEKMSLVEILEDGTPVRVSVQNKDIKDGFITASGMKKGIPFGIPFSTLDFPHITAQDISDVFRGHGLWTPEDFRTKPKEITSALMTIAGKYYSVLLAYIQDK